MLVTEAIAHRIAATCWLCSTWHRSISPYLLWFAFLPIEIIISGRSKGSATLNLRPKSITLLNLRKLGGFGIPSANSRTGEVSAVVTQTASWCCQEPRSRSLCHRGVEFRFDRRPHMSILPSQTSCTTSCFLIRSSLGWYTAKFWKGAWGYLHLANSVCFVVPMWHTLRFAKAVKAAKQVLARANTPWGPTKMEAAPTLNTCTKLFTTATHKHNHTPRNRKPKYVIGLLHFFSHLFTLWLMKKIL